MLNLVLLGAPGSGKGTQSAKLIDQYGLHHISTGEILRDHISRGTDIGKTADKFISKGQLIPDELMIQMLDDELRREKEGKQGFIFDGFPRTLPQADALEKLLEKHGMEPPAVIGLEVPEEELKRRLLERGKISGRSDDNEETIKKRLKVYHEQTEPLKEYYSTSGKYIPVNGLGVVEDIYSAIRAGILEKTGVERRQHKKY